MLMDDIGIQFDELLLIPQKRGRSEGRSARYHQSHPSVCGQKSEYDKAAIAASLNNPSKSYKLAKIQYDWLLSMEHIA